MAKRSNSSQLNGSRPAPSKPTASLVCYHKATMRYLCVFLSIVVVWTALIALALVVPAASHFGLYAVAQCLTLVFFYIGFYRK